MALGLIVRGRLNWFFNARHLIAHTIPRVELQRTFFPPAYHDIEATPLLHPGDQRLWTSLKVFLELRGQTTLHLPFREASKVGVHATYQSKFPLLMSFTRNRTGNGMVK